MRQVLGEQVVDEQPSGQQRQRKQRPAAPEEAEQQAFHGLQGREVADQPGRMLVLEAVVLEQQQERLEHRDGEQAVGQDREQDVGQDAWLFVDRLDGAVGNEYRQQGGEGAQRE